MAFFENFWSHQINRLTKMLRFNHKCKEALTPWPHGYHAMDPIADRVYGLVLGCALGDAVGLTTEFMTAAEAADTYDLLLNSRKAAGEAVCLQPKDAVRDAHRSKWFPGDWTDDTDQLVCVLRCLLPVEGRGLRAPEARDFAEQLMTWHRQGFPELGDANGCGMGRSTARVLDDPAFLQEPQACARRAWDSTGRCMAPNGALMRAAATGLRGKDHAEEDAKTIAEVTHADPRSTAACVAVAKMVAWMVERGTPGDGVDSLLSEAFASAERYLPHETSLGEMPQTVWACSLCTLENPPSEDNCDACGHPRPAAGSGSVNAGFGTTWSEAAAQARGYGRAAALEELRHALRGEAMPVTDHSETLGYVNTCLAAAIYVFRSSVLRKDVAGPQLFSEAIHSLAMAAGDADTNAAVAGALLGCALGRKALPELWLSQLPHRVWLEKIAEKLVAAMNCHSQG